MEKQEQTPETASPVEPVVMLTCGCGCKFEREKSYLDQYEEYKTEYPRAARFYKRKIENCDNCIKEKMKNALIKDLPAILKALAT